MKQTNLFDEEYYRFVVGESNSFDDEDDDMDNDIDDYDEYAMNQNRKRGW